MPVHWCLIKKNRHMLYLHSFYLKNIIPFYCCCFLHGFFVLDFVSKLFLGCWLWYEVIYSLSLLFQYASPSLLSLKHSTCHFCCWCHHFFCGSFIVVLLSYHFWCYCFWVISFVIVFVCHQFCCCFCLSSVSVVVLCLFVVPNHVYAIAVCLYINLFF